jgi:hypothetical protein
LAKHAIYTQAVLMREDGDYRPAAILKVELLQNYLLQTNHTIVEAFDDRADVIAAYQAMGLTAMRVEIEHQEVPVGH